MEKCLNIDLRAKLHFYFRHGLFNHVFLTAKDEFIQSKDAVHLYEAISLVQLNRLEEAINNLEKMIIENQLKLAATVTLKYSHKLIGTISKNFIMKLDAQVLELCKCSDGFAFYYASFSCMTFKEFDTALEYIDKALKLDHTVSEYHALKGWILVEYGQFSNDVQTIFQKSLQLNPNNVDAIIGLSEWFFKQSNFVESLSIINKAVVEYDFSDLLLIQKLRMQFGIMDWDQAIETAKRIILHDSRNLYARRLLVIVLLCYSADYDAALIELKKFSQILDSMESKNVMFLLESSKLFTMLSNQNKYILNQTYNMLSNILQYNSDNVDVLIEMGHQYLLRNQHRDALRYLDFF